MWVLNQLFRESKTVRLIEPNGYKQTRMRRLVESNVCNVAGPDRLNTNLYNNHGYFVFLIIIHRLSSSTPPPLHLYSWVTHPFSEQSHTWVGFYSIDDAPYITARTSLTSRSTHNGRFARMVWVVAQKDSPSPTGNLSRHTTFVLQKIPSFVHLTTASHQDDPITAVAHLLLLR